MDEEQCSHILRWKGESLLSNIVHFFRDWDYSKLLHPIECSLSFSVWFQQSRKWDFFFILLLTNSCETDQSGCGWKKAISFRPSFTMEQVLSVTYRSISHGEHLVSRHLGLSCKIRTFCRKETGRNHVIQGKLLGKDVTGSTASRNIRPVIYSQCEAMPIKSLPTLLYCGYSILFFLLVKLMCGNINKRCYGGVTVCNIVGYGSFNNCKLMEWKILAWSPSPICIEQTEGASGLSGLQPCSGLNESPYLVVWM